MSNDAELRRKILEGLNRRMEGKGHDAELRRKILEGLNRRMEGKGHALRSKDRLKLQSLTDQELEAAVEQTVRVREEAGRLRRDVFHERTARRLKGGL